MDVKWRPLLLSELRVFVDTGAFCASEGKTASSEPLDTSLRLLLEIKGDLATEKLRVVDCSRGTTVRRESQPVL